MTSTLVSSQQAVTPAETKKAAWVCFFAWACAVYDFVLFGNLLPVMAEDLGWVDAQATSINTWVTIGTAVVAFAFGPLIDRVGRRKGIIIAVLGAAAGSVLTAVAGLIAGIIAGVGIVALILARSIAGLGYAEQVVNAAYLGEMMSHTHAEPAKAKRRGLIYSLVQSGWPVGAVLAAVSSYLLLPIGGWALCFVAAVVPSVIVAYFARSLRESPQWQAMKEAEKSASQSAEHSEPRLQKALAVFRGESRRPLVAIGLAHTLEWFGVITFVILGTTLLTSSSGMNIEFNNALVILAISNFTAFFGYLFHGWLGDQIGRRNTVVIGWLLAAASFAAMLSCPPGSQMLIIAFYSAGLFFLIGAASALFFFNAESFPAQTRATGSAIINALGQVGAVLAGFVVTAALQAGMSWISIGYWWGCLPVAISAILVLCSRHISPRHVRAD